MGLLDEVGAHQRRSRAAEILSAGSVQVWGENIYYEASGVAEVGPAVLFLHESGGSSATWHGQLTGLAGRARCLVPDLPGHARSEGLGFETIEGYRDAIIAFLDALAIRWPVVIAGAACLGSAVAVDVALHAPHRVAGLVLAGASEGGRASANVLEATGLGEAPARFVAGFFSPDANKRLVQERLKQWRLTSPLVRHHDLMASRSYPIDANLRHVKQPVLLVAGECDAIASSATTQRLADNTPHPRVTTVPKAGCLSMLEQPAIFNREVSTFLDLLAQKAPVAPEELRPGGYRRRLAR